MSAPERGVAVWMVGNVANLGFYPDDGEDRHDWLSIPAAPGRWFPEADAAKLLAAERVAEAAQLFVERWHADHTHDPLGLVTALSDYDAARGAS